KIALLIIGSLFIAGLAPAFTVHEEYSKLADSPDSSVANTRPIMQAYDAASPSTVTKSPPRTTNSATKRRASLDMTQVARQFKPHQGPTMLYLNFDGAKNYDQKGHTIQPFQAVTGARERDIQEILYRTSQIFSPFNVQVVRIFGDGAFDGGSNGNTTVLIGG